MHARSGFSQIRIAQLASLPFFVFVLLCMPQSGGEAPLDPRAGSKETEAAAGSRHVLVAGLQSHFDIARPFCRMVPSCKKCRHSGFEL
eukprot:4030181-Pleurochrysis_carterae.AAC.1